jgi:hypothetical protein
LRRTGLTELGLAGLGLAVRWLPVLGLAGLWLTKLRRHTGLARLTELRRDTRLGWVLRLCGRAVGRRWVAGPGRRIATRLRWYGLLGVVS